ncbi:MAG TPA: acyl carrier protein [Gemmatimonadales bacterium]|nr:acyl carrier protein [Gemmatimonadales bacterium]
MTQAIQGELRTLIRQGATTSRHDYTPADVELYVKSLVVAFTGTWQYSRLTTRTHLYRDVRWDQAGVEQYRVALEELFGITLAPIPFLVARTVGDVCDQVLRGLVREGRAMTGPPAA